MSRAKSFIIKDCHHSVHPPQLLRHPQTLPLILQGLWTHTQEKICQFSIVKGCYCGRIHGYIGTRFTLLNVLQNSEKFPQILRNGFLHQIVLILPGIWTHTQEKIHQLNIVKGRYCVGLACCSRAVVQAW